MPIGRTRLQQDDPMPCFAQPGGDHAAGRTGTDNEIIAIRLGHSAFIPVMATI